MKRFFLFCISGTFGFLVDTSLYYLFALVFPYWGARALSFVGAVIFTWVFNRNLTFKGLRFQGGLIAEFASYFASMLAGGSINYATFILTIHAFALVAAYPILGIAAGAVAGLFVNFAASKFLIFREKQKVRGKTASS